MNGFTPALRSRLKKAQDEGFEPDEIPIVLEPLIDKGQSDIRTEIDRAYEALGVSPLDIA